MARQVKHDLHPLTRQLSHTEKLQIVLNNQSGYDGQFYYGVTTTGIFCRPSCRSKRPNEANIRFFDRMEEAMDAGFRPCKRCRSDQPVSGQQPMDHETSAQLQLAEQARALLEALVHQEMMQREQGWQGMFSDLGISRSRMEEIFKAHYGMTMAQYINKCRIEQAKVQLMKTDDEMLTIAMRVGYGSQATFYRRFKQATGETPAGYRQKNKQQS